MSKDYHIFKQLFLFFFFFNTLMSIAGQLDPDTGIQSVSKTEEADNSNFTEARKDEKEILLPDQSPLIFAMARDLLSPQIAEDDEMGPLADEKRAVVKFLRDFFQAYQNGRPLESFLDPRVNLVTQVYLSNFGPELQKFQQVRISRVKFVQGNMQFNLKFFYPQREVLGRVLVTGDPLKGYKILAFSLDTPM